MAGEGDARVDLRAVLETHAGQSELQTTFHGCIKRVLIPELNPPADLIETIKIIFSTTSHDLQTTYLQQYVGYLCMQNNHQRVRQLLSLLSSLTATGVIQARLVCDQLLCHIDISNMLFWGEALSTVRSIVGGVGYKGCRDLMKLLFDRFHRVPRSLPSSQLPTVGKGRDLLAYILDRNAALLPAYFAYDEICRHYPDKTRPPHWLLQEAIAPLRSSMQTLADLVSGVVLPHLRPVLSVSNMSLSTWKLEPDKYCCSLKGLLPYREVFMKPQAEMLYHVIAQPNSRDAVHSMLGMNRQQMQPCEMVEDALVQLALIAMEMVESVEGRGEEGEERVREVWSQLANKLVFFYFLQLINITSVINQLRQKLSSSHCRKGRSWLMWSLLHFVTSTVQSKLPAQQQPSASSTAVQLQREFVPILNLFSLLYPDREPLPPPDPTQLAAVLDTAMASIWVVYSSRAAADGVELPRPLPHILTAQIKWLEAQSELPPTPSNLATDHTVALLLSVYSNNADVSGKLLNSLIEAVAPPHSSSPATECSTLPLSSLSTIAMHAKIRLMDKVKLHLVQVAEASKQLPASQPPAITAALLETYSRLLIWLGTRNFQTQLIPAVFKSQAWPVLHALLEVIAYRVHLQLQYSYRFQLLQQLHTVVGVAIIPTQLFVCAENTTLRLIQGLSSPEFLLQLAKIYATDPKPLLSQESEELNRVFVCVLAQSMHISNLDTTNWLEAFMRAVFTAAPQNWPVTTSKFFPASLRQLCSGVNTAENQIALISKAEEEHRRFTVAKGKCNERELIQTYTESESASLFLCVLWQQLLETGAVSMTCIKIVQRSQAKKLASYARKMVDYIVFTCPSPSNSTPFNQVVVYLNELIWKYHIFPIDRLLLCMVMRGYDGQFAHISLSLVHHMLLTNQDLDNRVSSLMEEVQPDHWNCPDWHFTHAAFLQKFPESFYPDIPGAGLPSSPPPMTMYFGNACLRLLPVLCLYLHRLLELPDIASQYLEQILVKFGCLFSFHAHPVSLLYTTLHYYEQNLKERPLWKRQLVATVMGSQHRIHPLEWFFTPLFCEFLRAVKPVDGWAPPPHYFPTLLEQLLKGMQPFSLSAPSCDWQCTEFSGSLPLSLTCACVELLGLPQGGSAVGKQLLLALYSMAEERDKEEDVLALINAMALIFISLPECYRSVLYESVLAVVEDLAPDTLVPLTLTGGNRPSCLLSLMHAFWLHGNMGLLLTLPQWLQMRVGGLVCHEGQLLYVLQLLGPILHRVMAEKPKLLLDIVMEIYRLLKVVDQRQNGLVKHSNTICDFLYHIKYMHIGDAHGKKEELEQLVTSLHLPLKTRLRFLTHSLAEHAD